MFSLFSIRHISAELENNREAKIQRELLSRSNTSGANPLDFTTTMIIVLCKRGMLV